MIVPFGNLNHAHTCKKVTMATKTIYEQFDHTNTCQAYYCMKAEI